MNVLDKAQQLFDTCPRGKTEQIGHDVIALLEPLTVSDADEERRTRLLMLGYNWAFRHIDAYELAKRAVARFGDAKFAWDLVGMHMNAFWWPGDGFLESSDELIEQKLCHEAHWRIAKVGFLQGEATGERHSTIEEFEWQPGDPIVNPDALAQAAVELKHLLECDPPAELMKDWETAYSPILAHYDFSAYRT